MIREQLTPLRMLGMSTAIAAAMSVPALAQGQQSQQTGMGQNCQQQISAMQKQIVDLPQDRQEQMRKQIDTAQQAAQRGDGQRCMQIVSDLRRDLKQTGQAGQTGNQAQQSSQAGGADITVQQPPPQVTVQQPAPDVTVQQPQPQVTVQQPQPEVTVQQPQPQVTVQQPQPQVTVEQPQPEVTVQQAQPEVTVEQQGQPDVQVQRSGEPKVNVERTGQPQVNVQQQSGAQGEQTQSGAATDTSRLPPAFASMRAEQLIGQNIYGSAGEEVGEIEDIVINRNARATAALVDVGGFLGIGGRRIAVPMEQLNMQGDRIVATGMTREQVRQMPEYQTNGWESVERNETLSNLR